MIRVEQENQIELYLRSKKLSYQILFEVKDHFLSQISNLMDIQNLSFQEAFLKAQISWKYELEMVKADTFSFRKITRIEKNILQARFRQIIYVSLGFSVVLGSVALISEPLFFYLQMGVLLLLVLILMYNFIWKKMRFTEYRNLSFHPLLLRNIVIGVLIFPLGSYFSGTFEFWRPAVNQILMIYAPMVQIQLLYFRTKKINILLS